MSEASHGVGGRGAIDWRRAVAGVLVALYALALLYSVAANLDRLQWDFKTYFYAGRAFLRGLDPYDLEVLSRLAGEEIGFPYTYAPLTLPVFAVFASLQLSTAASGFLILKVLALLGLILIWLRWFFRERPDWFFFLFMVFGFGGALHSDFAAGNISVFEQVGLWLGFAALRGRRPWLFALAIALVGLWKLAPIMLLGILLLQNGRRAWGPLAGGLGLFAGLLGLSALLWPGLFESFLAVAQSFDERGGINPSSLAFFRDSLGYLEGRGFLAGSETLAWFAYGVWVCVIVLLTWRAVRKHPGGDARPAIFIACLAFALISPRFKNYAYILLLLPAYELLRAGVSIRPERALLLLLMFSGSPPVPFGFSAAGQELIRGYYSWLGALLIWALALGSAKSIRAAFGGSGPEDPPPALMQVRNG